MTTLDTASRTQQAKALLREMPEKQPGYKLGCISYVSRKLDIPYSAAWDILDALETSGFISPADGSGRRVLLEAP